MRLPEAPFHTEGVPTEGSTIAPGGSITITVTFAPTAVGSYEGEIELETTGGNGAVGLSGVAALPGALRVSSEAIDYGRVTVGGPS